MASEKIERLEHLAMKAISISGILGTGLIAPEAIFSNPAYTSFAQYNDFTKAGYGFLGLAAIGGLSMIAYATARFIADDVSDMFH